LLSTAGSAALHEAETAVYWAPSLTDQLRLAKYIMPALRRVGVLAAREDMPRVQALRTVAASQHIELVVRQTEPGLLVRQVAELAPLADVLLAPTNNDLFNRDSLKAVLMAAYRQNRVFIGPSPAYVRAGALASLYAPSATLADDVANAIREYQRRGHWPSPALVSHFDVITNPQVARALGLRLPDATVLTRLLQAEEAVSWP
jgi:putative ABC transport system substrate-binding protein